MTRLHGRVDRQASLLCLRSTAERLVLPAFGQLTRGHDCGDGYAQWLVADGAVVPWSTPIRPGRRAAPSGRRCIPAVEPGAARLVNVLRRKHWAGLLLAPVVVVGGLIAIALPRPPARR